MHPKPFRVFRICKYVYKIRIYFDPNLLIVLIGKARNRLASLCKSLLMGPINRSGTKCKRILETNLYFSKKQENSSRYFFVALFPKERVNESVISSLFSVYYP